MSLRITEGQELDRINFSEYIQSNTKNKNWTFIATEKTCPIDVHALCNGKEMAGYVHKRVNGKARMIIKSSLFDKYHNFQRANKHTDGNMPELWIFFERDDGYYVITWDQLRNNARMLMTLPERDGKFETGFIVLESECHFIAKETADAV